MEVKEIRKLLDALASTDVNELTLETGEYKLTVRRGQDGNQNGRLITQSQAAAIQAQATPQQPASQQSAVDQSAADQSAADQAAANQTGAAGAAHSPRSAGGRPEGSADSTAHLAEVSAPIVGTFYAAPSPETEDYVKVGDRVERGAVLCIIEAMKLMNEIEAETAGTIKEILVHNEEPVEYGQVLFRIDPR
ncbi:MAG: acetyl-CoA carboxylase biotin carboxyl carrier protein [Trueperaceae bacterium]